MAAERGFASAEAMDQHLIRLWQERIKDTDVVVLLGDLFRISNNRYDPRQILDVLPGNKLLIRGNHDLDFLTTLTEAERALYFCGITDILSCNFGGVEVTFSHYPMISWEGSREKNGSVLICGHIHGFTAEESLEEVSKGGEQK